MVPWAAICHFDFVSYDIFILLNNFRTSRKINLIWFSCFRIRKYRNFRTLCEIVIIPNLNVAASYIGVLFFVILLIIRVDC